MTRSSYPHWPHAVWLWAVEQHGSQRKLAAALGVSPATVHKYLHRSKPTARKPQTKPDRRAEWFRLEVTRNEG